MNINPKIKAEEYLLGAMLREPIGLANQIGRLNTLALQNASNGLCDVFLEIIKQFTEKGQYNITTLREAGSRIKKDGLDPFNNLEYVASENTELDLDWAVENWWYEYTKWGELMAYSAAAVVDGDALQMREKLEETRNSLGLNSSEKKNTGKDDFLQWGIDKMEGRERVYKTSVPLAALYEIIKAFKPGYMTIIAGRPAMGKTQFSLNLLNHFSEKGAKGLFFSLEMTAEDIYRRLLGIKYGIDSESEWRDCDHQHISGALMGTAERNLQIIDDIFNISEIEATCISAHYRGGLDYVFVDYIGLVKLSSDTLKRSQNREREIATISESFVRLSKRLKCPVIVLSQLNRAVETRGGSKRPSLSDLRDSGSLEQDAANILFLYRPEYYQILENEKGESLVGKGEIIVAKQRNGRTDTALCEFNPIRGYRDIQTEFTPTQPTSNFVPFPTNRQEPDPDLPF